MQEMTTGLEKKSSRNCKTLLWKTFGVRGPNKSLPAKLGESNTCCNNVIASSPLQDVGRQTPTWIVDCELKKKGLLRINKIAD